MPSSKHTRKGRTSVQRHEEQAGRSNSRVPNSNVGITKDTVYRDNQTATESGADSGARDPQDIPETSKAKTHQMNNANNEATPFPALASPGQVPSSEDVPTGPVTIDELSGLLEQRVRFNADYLGRQERLLTRLENGRETLETCAQRLREFTEELHANNTDLFTRLDQFPDRGFATDQPAAKTQVAEENLYDAESVQESDDEDAPQVQVESDNGYNDEGSIQLEAESTNEAPNPNQASEEALREADEGPGNEGIVQADTESLHEGSIQLDDETDERENQGWYDRIDPFEGGARFAIQNLEHRVDELTEQANATNEIVNVEIPGLGARLDAQEAILHRHADALQGDQAGWWPQGRRLDAREAALQGLEARMSALEAAPHQALEQGPRRIQTTGIGTLQNCNDCNIEFNVNSRRGLD